MKIVATIEARMNSSRLPGKVLMDIGGIKSLECQIQRMQKSKYIDEIVLATTINTSDDNLVEFAKKNNISIYRGSENDVMKRILGAAQFFNADLQVQTTGDCPLIDPKIIDQVIKVFLNGDGCYDFVSNEIERSYPIGLDCRVFPVEILASAEKICKDPVHRMHGSTFIYMGEGKEVYVSKNVLAPKKLRHPGFRWTLDEKKDLKFIRKVIQHFNGRVTEFSATELIDWLKHHPEIVDINASVMQKNIEEG